MAGSSVIHDKVKEKEKDKKKVKAKQQSGGALASSDAQPRSEVSEAPDEKMGDAASSSSPEEVDPAILKLIKRTASAVGKSGHRCEKWFCA